MTRFSILFFLYQKKKKKKKKKIAYQPYLAFSDMLPEPNIFFDLA